MEPDAEADPDIDFFFEVPDVLEVAVVPVDDESVADDESIVGLDDEPAMVALEPSMLLVAEEVSPAATDPVEDPLVVAAPVAPVDEDSVEAPAVDAPVVSVTAAPVVPVAAAPVVEAAVGDATPVVVAAFWAEVPAMASAAMMRTWKTFMLAGWSLGDLVGVRQIAE
ncbi:uncharacterized protein IUM83_12132 [Phytophthora cinnamomi]|uniref:uncharacterized protein n=1 Tax=Phytophthora cinnamomi TaxID=4785 RepID=UPI00355950D4|nr:hypothetical protein IUM83_12132 [Phytophthora cinnamomi]